MFRFFTLFCLLNISILFVASNSEINNHLLNELNELSNQQKNLMENAQLSMIESEANSEQTPFNAEEPTADAAPFSNAMNRNVLAINGQIVASASPYVQSALPIATPLGTLGLAAPLVNGELTQLNTVATDLSLKQATVQHQRQELAADANKLRRLAALLRNNREVLSRNERSLAAASNNYLRAVQRYTSSITKDAYYKLQHSINGAVNGNSAQLYSNLAAFPVGAGESLSAPSAARPSAPAASGKQAAAPAKKAAAPAKKAAAPAKKAAAPAKKAAAQAKPASPKKSSPATGSRFLEMESEISTKFENEQENELESEVEQENEQQLEADSELQTDAETDAAIASVVDTETLAEAWEKHENSLDDYKPSSKMERIKAAMALREASAVEKFSHELEESEKQDQIRKEEEHSAL